MLKLPLVRLSKTVTPLLLACLLGSQGACQKKSGGSAEAVPAPAPAPMTQPRDSRTDGERPAPSSPPVPIGTDTMPASPVQPTYRDQVRTLTKEATDNGFRDSNAGIAHAPSVSSFGSITPYCAKGIDCRSKFVEVNFARNDGTGGTCSGVLISREFILTNHHCAGLIVDKANQSFNGGSINLRFPFSKKGQRTQSDMGLVQNVTLLSPSDVNNPVSSPDWAILRVESGTSIPEDIKPPKLNRGGFVNGKTYYVYSKSPFADAKDPNAIERKACKAIYQTAFATWFDRPLLPVVELSDCPIGPGNSGAPIYNENEEVVGIIGGQFNQRLLQSLSVLASLDWGLLLSPSGFANLGWGMTLGCIPDLEHPEVELPEDCDLGSRPAPLLALPKSAVAKAAEILKTATPKSDQFQFEIVTAQPEKSNFAMIGQLLVFQVPECITLDALQSLTSGEVPLKLNASGVVVSREGVALDQAAALHQRDVKVVFDLDSLKNKPGNVQMKISTTDPEIVLHVGLLRICGK